MLTFRFQFHDNRENHDVLQGARYSVRTELYHEEEQDAGSKPPKRRTIRIHESLHDDDPRYEYVGDRDAYSICFVMNEAGNTVDTIKS